MQKLNLKKVKPINIPNHCVLLSQNSKQPTKAQIKTKPTTSNKIVNN